MIDLYNGDCLEIMKTIKDDSIDLIVTDPPYLQSYKDDHRKDKTHPFCKEIANDEDNDDNQGMIHDYIKDCYRILKNNTGFYCFCNINKIDFFKQEIENVGFVIKNIIIWEKNLGTVGDLDGAFQHRYEFLIYANKGRKLINGKRIDDIWKFDKVTSKKQIHQNQKPVNLLKQCILKSSNEGDLVFDGFMGSGSTGVACKLTNRNFIGIELDKHHFNNAEQRINNQIVINTDKMKEEINNSPLFN